MMHSVAIGLGSNIDPEKNLTKAAGRLRGHFSGIRFSSVYSTAPRERTDQPDFLNAVAVFTTERSPNDIVEVLHVIEGKLGKAPPFRFGPRTIDLDLLLYDDVVINQPNMSIPHPRMHERRFVLKPLLELIDPKSLHPILKKSWSELLELTKGQECRLAELAL